jgi:hypothetical protein
VPGRIQPGFAAELDLLLFGEQREKCSQASACQGGRLANVYASNLACDIVSAFSRVTRLHQNGRMPRRIEIFAVDESDELRIFAS